MIDRSFSVHIDRPPQEVFGYEPGVEAVYRSDGSYFSGLVTFRVEAEGDGARFDVSEKGGSTGLLRLFESRLARSSGRQRETMMAIIKEKLEGQG
jgi:carbon monoxide dehydrogenase subunit G